MPKRKVAIKKGSKRPVGRPTKKVVERERRKKIKAEIEALATENRLIDRSYLPLFVVVLILLLIVALVRSLGSKTPVTLENTATQSTPTPSGIETAPAASLPANWPSDVTVYPGATLKSATEDPDNHAKEVSYATDAVADQVVDYYNSTLGKSGWLGRGFRIVSGMSEYTYVRDNTILIIDVVRGAPVTVTLTIQS